MLRRLPISKSLGRNSWIRPIKYSMIIKIRLRLCTPKCYCAMLWRNRRLRLSLRRRGSSFTKRLISNGRSSRNKKWSNTMKDSEKSSRRNIIRK